jgi:hypothetical protein
MKEHWKMAVAGVLLVAAILAPSIHTPSKKIPVDAGSWIEQQQGFRVAPCPPIAHGDRIVSPGIVKVDLPEGYRLVSAPIPVASQFGGRYCVTVTLANAVGSAYLTTYVDLSRAIQRTGTPTPTIVWTPTEAATR